MLTNHLQRLESIDPIRSLGTITRAVGLVVESKGPFVSVGDLCYLDHQSNHPSAPESLLEVVGFRDSTILLLPLGQMPQIRPGDRLVAAGVAAQVRVGAGLLG
ncbi:MAG TPA: hypothetical protein PKZ53_17800, partial [Acidobacteriota bacterium]|nr:hypothetical protein [Acidobacteriota bacterium]